MGEIDKKFIELYQEIGRSYGIGDPLLLIIFARLYIEPEPVAMDDLAEETGYSLASISNHVRMLGQLFPIKKSKKPGSKKIFLYIEKNIVNMFKEQLLRKEGSFFRIVKEKLPYIIGESKDKVKSDKEKQKLKILRDYYEQIMKCEPIMHEMIKKLEEIEK